MTPKAGATAAPAITVSKDNDKILPTNKNTSNVVTNITTFIAFSSINFNFMTSVFRSYQIPFQLSKDQAGSDIKDKYDHKQNQSGKHQCRFIKRQ